jgi:hypothetical protein
MKRIILLVVLISLIASGNAYAMGGAMMGGMMGSHSRESKMDKQETMDTHQEHMKPGRHAVFAEFKHNGVVRKVDMVVNVNEEPRDDRDFIQNLKPSE